MTTLEKTSARIRELVPRLKELSFGCEVVWDNQLQGFYVGKKATNHAAILSNKKGWIPPLQPDSEKEIEIIGHPITLEDIIEAVDMISDFDGYDWSVGKWKTFLRDIVTKWQYGNTYDQQGEDLWKLIEDILF